MINPPETQLAVKIPLELEVVAHASGLDNARSLALSTEFSPFMIQAKEWQEKIDTVTDARIARPSRLLLKKIRIEAEKKRKELKDESLKIGKAIDQLYNVVEKIIEPLETKLLEIEEKQEREDAAKKEALHAERAAALQAVGLLTDFLPLGDMPEVHFEQMLANGKLAQETRIAKEKAEAEALAEQKRKDEEARVAKEKADEEARLAKEKADADERERVRLENERLRKEAEDRETAAKAERDRLAAENAELERKRAEEKAESDRLLAQQKEEADRQRQEALDAAAEEKRKADELLAQQNAAFKKKQADAAAKAKRERDANLAQAKKDREALEKAEAEAKELRDAQAAEQARIELEAAKAAAAPDAQKLSALAQTIRELHMPEMATEPGKRLLRTAVTNLSDLALKIEGDAAALAESPLTASLPFPGFDAS